MNNYVLYKHTSPSSKSYIGITNNYAKRCSGHRRTKFCRTFYSAIQKYGWGQISHQILRNNLSLNEANRLETRYIKQHNTLYPNGYNLTTGGDSKVLSEATKRRVTKQNRIRNCGKLLSDEHKNKISQSLKGRTLTEERKLKNCRRYLVTSFQGKQYSVVNLNQFCKNKKLNNGCMTRVAQGTLNHYKNWLVMYSD